MLSGPRALALLAAAGVPVAPPGAVPAGAARLRVGVALDRDERSFKLRGARLGVRGSTPVSVTVDPVVGPRDFLIGLLLRGLGLGSPRASRAGEVVRRLYEFSRSRDALAVEAAPLALTEDGEALVEDARIDLDPSAGFRHPDLAAAGAFAPAGTPVERELARAGAVGVEVDPGGRIVGLISGAGLMMATLDMLVDAGTPPRLMVDLGGTVLRGAGALAPVFAAAAAAVVSPVVLVNAFLQTARCEDLATAVVEALRGVPGSRAVIVRLKGRGLSRARDILGRAGLRTVEDLDATVAAVARAAAP